jgi:hypothetical protein
MLPTKLRFIWPSGFRGEEFKKSYNQKQESPMVAMFVNGSVRNEQSSYQASFHLAKQFQRRRFKKIGQSETRIACGGHIVSDRFISKKSSPLLKER